MIADLLETSFDVQLQGVEIDLVDVTVSSLPPRATAFTLSLKLGIVYQEWLDPWGILFFVTLIDVTYLDNARDP